MSALLRKVTGDIAIPLAIQRDPGKLAAQAIADQFNLWLGEWFLDTTQGFPWVQRILGKTSVNLTQVRGLLRQAILLVPGVIAVEELNVTFDRVNLALAYFASAKLDTGQVVTGGSGVPFVVSGSSS